MDLYGRSWRITVDTLQMEHIDCSFQVKKTLKPEPNTCDLKLYNLTASHRRQIEQNPAVLELKKVPVIVEAGYGNTRSQIFKGELRGASSVTNGPDIVTELSTGDGEKAIATARLNVPFGPGTSVQAVIEKIVSTIGVLKGNVVQATAILAAKGQVTFCTKGVVLKGNAADQMTDLCKSAGLEWSIQDGAIQVLSLGQPLAGQALVLDSNTGLVGSPAVDSKGVLSATCLMVPGLRPGAQVQINGKHVRGLFRIAVCEYEGDTKGNDWYVKFQAEKPKSP